MNFSHSSPDLDKKNVIAIQQKQFSFQPSISYSNRSHSLSTQSHHGIHGHHKLFSPSTSLTTVTSPTTAKQENYHPPKIGGNALTTAMRAIHMTANQLS